ncbi:alpha/beta-hydrolase [Microthyrium microscopicum]|uniref:Alpha/beta-hydrolase n=1 Tax=Microthyrium microscopicum TaxID=703497 RepID=A0A6A6UF51_9PEZI|nr:alpha/beta-hydrolase [Microthyrium microscopicum]
MRSEIATSVLFASGAVAQAAGCSPLHLVYARATTEPPASYSEGAFDTAAARTWSKGYGAAGMSLLTNVTALIPGATGYPVHYPASFVGDSSSQGVANMVKELTEKSKACPSMKFAIGGHSQGGFVTTGSIPKLPADVLKKVVAVTMFGAPECPASVADRCVSYCNTGDSVCDKRGSGSAGAAKGGKGRGKGKGAPSGEMVEAEVEERKVKRAPAMIEAAPDCAKYASIQTSGLGSGGHLGYNKDGTYTRAAACYILAKFKA